MIGLTSDHIKPCNVGQSEAHNRRTPEYMAHINSDRIYLRSDLTSDNRQWISPALNDISLQEYYDQIAIMVKEKTGRAMQVKDRERKDKKTGRVKIIRGSSPLRESVVVCDQHTTIEKLRTYARLCTERFGITPLQIFLHRDEGHYEDPSDPNSWKPNYHAHIMWDWMDHETGKSIKLNAEDMSKMQDLLSLALMMRRGKSKSETGVEHLERADFIVAKQKKETKEAVIKMRDVQTAIEIAKEECAEATAQRDEIQADCDRLMQKAKSKEQEILSLDGTIRQKRVIASQSGENIAIQQLNEMVKWRNDLLGLIGNFLYSAWITFKKAVDALIKFAKGIFNIMDPDEAKAVKDVMDALAPGNGNRIAVGNLIVDVADRKGRLTEAQYHKIQNEVDDVANGVYDSRIRGAGHHL